MQVTHASSVARPSLSEQPIGCAMGELSRVEHHCPLILIAALWLSALLAVHATAATADAPATGPGSGQLVWRTGWLGNTFKGGDWNKGRWVQIDIDDIFVFPDGRVVTNTIWDEACRAIGFYRDGDAIGKVDDPTALTGGLAVTADAQFIFALRLERKLGDSDPMWQGVARYTLEGKPAKWPGAEGRVRNVLFLHPPFDKGGKSLTGVAARDGELFLADPISRKVKVYGTSDMAPKREFGLTPDTDTPYKMAFDKAGRLWIGQKGAEGTWRLRVYDARAGAYANLEIPDPGEPAGLALAPDGRLAVADNGPRQQVRFYAVDGAAVLKGTLGVAGGVYAAPNPGRVAADRFGGLTGVGLDQQGNVYASSNGRGPGDDNGFGAKLQKFDPAGKCLWMLEGLEFVDSADVDPGEETSVHSKDARYEVDWSKPTGEGWPHAGWAHRALTIHRFKYPNDPRLHIRQEGVRVVRVRGGRKLQSCQWDGHLCVYRFDGEIAVPAAVFSRGGSKPGEWPPNNPHNNKAWMWADKNGDGEFQADEFDAIAPGDIDVMRAYFLDEEGTAWIGEQNGKIHRFPLEPDDGKAGPLYVLKTRTTVKAPDDITNIRSLRYVAGQDTMFLATYSKATPMQTWYPMAREIRRYDKWSSDRKLAWTTEIPYRFSDKRGRDIMPICMDAEGDYVFVGYTLGAGDKERCGEVVIFRASDGSRVGSVWAGPEVGGRIGAVDFSSAVHVHKRADGTYVILVEDDLFAKIIYYLWKPDVSAEPNR